MRKLFQIFITLLSLNMFFSCGKEDITIKNLTLDISSLTLTINETHQFVVSITPTNLQAPIYTWSTSNKDVVTVDDNGTIKAISVGVSTITVFNPDKTLQSSCEVNVQPIKATGLSFDVKNVELHVDEEIVLTYKVMPENTTNKKITWSSENKNIAIVDSIGNVKAIGVGETKIIAMTNNLISDICNIKVNPVKATSISLSQNSLVLEISDKQSLSVNFTPLNTTNKKLLWTSSNPSVATVSDKGQITGIREGNCIIAAKSEDIELSSNCNVEVKLKGIVLTKHSITMIPNEKELIWIYYTINNEAYKNAKWISSNPQIASVTSDGVGTNSAVIESFNIGSTNIIATSADGMKSDICSINVEKIDNLITIEANPQSMTSHSTNSSYQVGCRITNPTNSTIYLDAIVLINELSFGLQNIAPMGSRYLANGSAVAFFNSITINGSWTTTQNILSNYKVMVQYSIKGKTYQIYSKVDATKFGGFY